MAYYKQTWLEVRWIDVRELSVYGMSIRTNNEQEGWHLRLKTHGRANMNIYLLIQLLHQESQWTALVVDLVSDGKVCRYQRRKYRNVQGKILQLWEDRRKGKISPSQLLKKVSGFYAPCEDRFIRRYRRTSQ